LTQAFLSEGLTFSAIADKLGFHRCTIGREISRNSGGRGYRRKQASQMASGRQTYREQPRKMLPELIDRIEEKIKDAPPIEERGKGAELRKKCGYGERDCMIGKDRKNAVIAMVDRKSRYNLFSKIK
jgi:IS30 family transposase